MNFGARTGWSPCRPGTVWQTSKLSPSVH
jgi:hypothetical protein